MLLPFTGHRQQQRWIPDNLETGQQTQILALLSSFRPVSSLSASSTAIPSADQIGHRPPRRQRHSRSRVEVCRQWEWANIVDIQRGDREFCWKIWGWYSWEVAKIELHWINLTDTFFLWVSNDKNVCGHWTLHLANPRTFTVTFIAKSWDLLSFNFAN